MQKYYKIITSVSLFKDIYDIDNIQTIPKGSVFVAKEPDDAPPHVILDNQFPVLHFSDGAFDAMLWYSLVFNPRLEGCYQDDCIYEIRPLSPVVWGKCNDEHRIFQCGANIIEFGEKIPADQIARQAIEEYKKHKIEKYVIYNRHLVKSQVKLWQNFYSM